MAPTRVHESSSAGHDPARFFENAEWWFTTWKYRFLPKSYLIAGAAANWDEGLERLVYFQSLITEDEEPSQEMSFASAFESEAVPGGRPVLTSYDDGFEFTAEHQAMLREMLRDEEDEPVILTAPV